MKISVVIIAKNEEAKIADCIASVQFCDDIVLIDDVSDDATGKIAKDLGARVFVNKMTGYATQKNLGIDKAKNDWVLILDADERVSVELQKEILSLKPSSNTTGYEMPFRNHLKGKWLRHGGLYPDYHVRLFNKTKGKYGAREVHEMLELDGEVNKLEGDVIHLTYDTYRAYLAKVRKYSVVQAQEDVRTKGRGVDTKGPIREFVARYIKQKGILDGWAGFVSALYLAHYVHLYNQAVKRSL